MMAAESPVILCAGYANWDIVLQVDALPDTDHAAALQHRHETLGGSAANTALGLETLGTNTALLARVGTDIQGQQITDTLSGHGVTSFVKETEDPTNTVFCLAATGNDPQYLVDLHGHAGITSADVPRETWNAVNHVHVTSFDPDLAGIVAEEAASDGKSVSFNPTQDYELHEFPRAVNAADLLIVNDTEYRFLLDRYDVPELVSNGSTIVRTHGSDGATVTTPTVTTDHEGYRVDAADVVDPVGAGDSFVAALLNEWLESPVSPHHPGTHARPTDKRIWTQLVATANAAGAYAVLHEGPPTGLDGDAIADIVSGTHPTNAVQ